MDEALDALFEFDEDAVVNDTDDLAFDFSACWIFFRGADPRIVRELLEAERDALLFLVELEDDDFDFLIGLDDVGRMLDAAPAQIGEVEEAVDAAEIDEGAVLGDVFHVALDLVALVERFHELSALGVELFFEQRAAADNDIAAAAIQLGDAHLDFGVHQVVEIGGGAEVELRTRKEMRARRCQRRGRP